MRELPVDNGAFLVPHAGAASEVASIRRELGPHWRSIPKPLERLIRTELRFASRGVTLGLDNCRSAAAFLDTEVREFLPSQVPPGSYGRTARTLNRLVESLLRRPLPAPTLRYRDLAPALARLGARAMRSVPPGLGAVGAVHAVLDTINGPVVLSVTRTYPHARNEWVVMAHVTRNRYTTPTHLSFNRDVRELEQNLRRVARLPCLVLSEPAGWAEFVAANFR